MNMENVFKGVFAVVLSVVTYLFGGWDGLLAAFVTVMALDYATGILCGIHDKKLSSAVGAKGIVKKFMYLIIVALAHIVDGVVNTEGLLRDASVYFFIANEGLSIVENAGKLGFPLPQKLKDVLEQLKGK